MLLETVATALNLRAAPGGAIIGELRSGDLAEWDRGEKEWIKVKVQSGHCAGMVGVVRRKWLIQHYEETPSLANVSRSRAADIIRRRSKEFDSIHYGLGSKAKSWEDLATRGSVDCSGWVYLLSREILKTYELNTQPGLLYTYSDEQITSVGKHTNGIISGRFLKAEHFVPGTLVGVDFDEYSWDRGRPLDIDHIAIVGNDDNGLVISQSSSSGGGVNTVPLDKWLKSRTQLIAMGRVHLVDLLALP